MEYEYSATLIFYLLVQTEPVSFTGKPRGQFLYFQPAQKSVDMFCDAVRTKLVNASMINQELGKADIPEIRDSVVAMAKKDLQRLLKIPAVPAAIKIEPTTATGAAQSDPEKDELKATIAEQAAKITELEDALKTLEAELAAVTKAGRYVDVTVVAPRWDTLVSAFSKNLIW